MPSVLLDLPPELLIDILYHLPYPTVLACARTNRLLRQLLTNSPRLQYHVQTEIAGTHPVTTTSTSSLTLPDRLKLLKSRETAWRSLRFSGKTSIPIPHRVSGIYDLTGGIYLLGEAPPSEQRGAQARIERTRAIRYVRLPSSPADGASLEWHRIDVGEEVVDVGLNVRELDLIAILTRHHGDLNLHLVQLSTGAPHPLASNPVLHVFPEPLSAAHISINIEVVGRTCVALITFPLDSEQRDRLFVFDWIAGKRLLSHSSEHATYSSFTFITPSSIVLPNLHANTLDLCNLPCQPTEQLTPSVRLGLPPLLPDIHIIRATARGEPNPTGPSGLFAGGFADAEPNPSRAADAIVMFSITLQDQQRIGQLPAALTWSPPVSTAFVMHRSALVGMLEAASAQPPRAARTQAQALAELQGEGPQGGDADGHDAEEEAVTLAWAAWGPTRTRWFDTREVPTRWITVTTGQRYVWMHEVGRQGTLQPERMLVWDFNPASVKKTVWADKARLKARVQEIQQNKDKGKWRVIDPLLDQTSTRESSGFEGWLAPGSFDPAPAPAPVSQPSASARASSPPRTIRLGDIHEDQEMLFQSSDMGAYGAYDDDMDILRPSWTTRAFGVGPFPMFTPWDSFAPMLAEPGLDRAYERQWDEEFPMPTEYAQTESASDSGRSDGPEEVESDGEDDLVSKRAITWPTELTVRNLFAEKIFSSLPYVQSEAKKPFEDMYGSLLMEEGRVIGMMMDPDGEDVTRVDVFHVE